MKRSRRFALSVGRVLRRLGDGFIGAVPPILRPVAWDLRLHARVLLHGLVPGLVGRRPKADPDWKRWVGQVVTVDGMRVLLDKSLSPRMIARIARGNHAREERAVVLGELMPADVVVELGSGVGMVAIACAQRIGSGRVYCYEANPELEPLARANFALNGVSPTLKIAMLGREPGESQFCISRDFWNSSVYRGESAVRTVTVPVLSFDAEVAAADASFLVVDIEGAEVDLLPHVDLGRMRAIVLEVHPETVGAGRTNRMRRLLRTRGFREVLVCGGNVFLYRRSNKRMDWDEGSTPVCGPGPDRPNVPRVRDVSSTTDGSCSRRSGGSGRVS